MKVKMAFIIIPILGYLGLWVLGTILFLVYFDLFGVSLNQSYNVMIQMIPALLAIATVPLCSFVSFFLTTRTVLRRLSKPLSVTAAFEIGIVSLMAAIGLDLLITVKLQGVNILVFPANLMYLFAYLVIVPSVVFAAYQKHTSIL